jgi:hypothetical protein
MGYDSHTNFLNVLDLKCLKLISTPLCTAFGILPASECHDDDSDGSLYLGINFGDSQFLRGNS